MAWFSRLVLACVTFGTTAAHAQPLPYQHVARLEAPSPAARGLFGADVAMDGRWAVIGEPRRQVSGPENLGVVHVFELRDGAWLPALHLSGPDTLRRDGFGNALAISGDTLVVGSDNRACSAGTSCGAVYVFVERDGSWQFDARLEAPVPAMYEQFGYTVALDGDTLVVGARGGAAAVRNAGMLHVFERDDAGVFRHHTALQPARLAARAQFGESLAVKGDTILAGATSDRVGGVALGAVYVLRRSDAGWSQEARFTGESSETSFGSDLLMAGDVWFVSALLDTDVDRTDTGSVRMFGRVNGEVRELQKIVDPSPGLIDSTFGLGFAVSGDRLLVGSRDDTPDARTDGAVQVFVLQDGHATWLEELRSPGGNTDDGFGGRLASAGGYVLVSAIRDSQTADEAGAAHLFRDPREATGTACTVAGGCLSGHCVDGWCCESACGGDASDCTACSAALTGESDGQCAPVLTGTACGDGGAESCSAPDTCDGAGLCQSNDLADGSPCDDGLFCSADDTCREGQCTAGAARACDADLECVEAEGACASVCGNGVIQRGEACDDGSENSDTLPDACRTGCALARCGDGVVDAGEGCDDGAANSATGACHVDCSLPSCGDGTRDAGEQCDEGTANDDTRPDACRTTCVAAACGDGVVDHGEACDEGHANSDVQPDHCRRTCTAPRCGDGVVDQGESCDDGAETASCSAQCVVPLCPDGTCSDAGTEQDAGAGPVDTDAGAGTDGGADPGAGRSDGCTLGPVASRNLLAPLTLVCAVLSLRRRRQRRG